MGKSSRRKFLGWTGLIAGGAASGSCAGDMHRAASFEPDLVVTNGRIYTMDDEFPRAEAFAVKGGRFVAVGRSEDVGNLISGSTEVIDAEGMTLTPGFIDAHTHPEGVEELTGVNVDLRSIEGIKSALRKKASATPPGYWVEGYKYDDTKLNEGRPILRKDLDEAVPDHPAMVGHRGGHTGVFNSRAFELAGITAETPDPEGGRFYRENGELTGKVAEQAMGAFGRVGKREEVTRETRRKGIEFISSEMAAAGLTSVHVVWGYALLFRAFQDAHDAGTMLFRVNFFPHGKTGMYRDLKAAGIKTGFGDEWLRIGAVKYVADGSASERTMRMSTPFVGRPNDYGILTMSQQEIHEMVEEAHRNGYQVGIHANGDVTIDMVLKAYERVQEKFPRPDPRHRLEHCSLVTPKLLDRIKAVGAIPTPFYTYVHYHGNKWVEYGEEKMEWMFAHRSFLDHGIPVAPASDYMPGPFPPLMAIQSMVTRKDTQGRVWGPSQRISVAQALRVCTVNGAYASFEENLKGSITAGKLADFVVLAEDPHETDPDHIKEIKVVRTVVGGRTVYRA